jgi:hypothetical protein
MHFYPDIRNPGFDSCLFLQSLHVLWPRWTSCQLEGSLSVTVEQFDTLNKIAAFEAYPIRVLHIPWRKEFRHSPQIRTSKRGPRFVRGVNLSYSLLSNSLLLNCSPSDHFADLMISRLIEKHKEFIVAMRQLSLVISASPSVVLPRAEHAGHAF